MLGLVLPRSECQFLEARGRPVFPISDSLSINVFGNLNWPSFLKGNDTTTRNTSQGCGCLCRVRLKQQALAPSSPAVAVKNDSATECEVYSFAPEQPHSPHHVTQMPGRACHPLQPPLTPALDRTAIPYLE